MTEIKKTSTNSRALVLNQGGMPIDIVSWDESVVACLTGKAISLAEYPNMFVHTGYNKITGKRSKLAVPSVIQKLSAPVDKVQFVRTIPPTRENLLHRDNHRCCYCHTKLTTTTATIEHVYPESKGGLSDWANCRAACLTCNGLKGDKLLSELGWSLTHVDIPTIKGDASKSIIYKVGGRVLDESWRPYINWEVKWR